jgi:CDGSH-type Zn-finger protein
MEEYTDSKDKKSIEKYWCAECKNSKIVPTIPQYAPYTVKGLLADVTYNYCTCGRSKEQPWCDHACDSHVDEEGIPYFRPLPFKLKKPQSIHLICGCRYSSHIPFCDGYHGVMEPNPTKPPCQCEKSKQLEW